MLLEVYDKNTMNRVEIIRTYTFVQYTDYFNDVGTFEIKVPINEQSLPYLMVQGNYVLFEKLGNKLTMGVIKYFHKEGLESVEVDIKGYMLSHLLSYRCFPKTYRKYGRVFDIQREFVTNMFINPEDDRRKVEEFMLSPNYATDTERIQYCQTGSDLAESIREMNAPYHYGFSLTPAIAKYSPISGRTQNIMSIVFEQYVPADHRVKNEAGNLPVVFDTDLNNLEDVMYEINGTKAKSTVLVAGEDAGEKRHLVEGGDTEATGLNRNEFYVDARDLQTETDDEEEPMSDEEYEEALLERGMEKLQENALQYAFEATAYTKSNCAFQYGTDYKNGDFVTVIDRMLGLSVGVQITGVTRSLTETGDILDLIFGNQVLSVEHEDSGDYIILPYQDTIDFMNSDDTEDYGYSTLTYAETMTILQGEG